MVEERKAANCPGVHKVWASIAFAAGLLAGLYMPASAQARLAPAGLARDGTGEVYVLGVDGMLRGTREPASSKRLEGVSGGVQIIDLTVDAKGHLVVPMTVFNSVTNELSGRVVVYDWTGRMIDGVRLPARWQPHRAAMCGWRIAVLATNLKDGFALFFLDQSYDVSSNRPTRLPFDCHGAFNLLTMAIEETGIWVGPEEACEEGYVVRKFDDRGRVIAQISKRGREVPPLDGEYSEDLNPRIVPVVRDIFVAGNHIGIVLNRATDTAVFVDLWTTAGEFVKRVKLSAPLVRRSVGRRDGIVDFVQVDGSVATTTISALLEVPPVESEVAVSRAAAEERKASPARAKGP